MTSVSTSSPSDEFYDAVQALPLHSCIAPSKLSIPLSYKLVVDFVGNREWTDTTSLLESSHVRSLKVGLWRSDQVFRLTVDSRHTSGHHFVHLLVTEDGLDRALCKNCPQG